MMHTCSLDSRPRLIKGHRKKYLALNCKFGLCASIRVALQQQGLDFMEISTPKIDQGGRLANKPQTQQKVTLAFLSFFPVKVLTVI